MMSRVCGISGKAVLYGNKKLMPWTAYSCDSIEVFDVLQSSESKWSPCMVAYGVYDWKLSVLSKYCDIASLYLGMKSTFLSRESGFADFPECTLRCVIWSLISSFFATSGAVDHWAKRRYLSLVSHQESLLVPHEIREGGLLPTWGTMPFAICCQDTKDSKWNKHFHKMYVSASLRSRCASEFLSLVTKNQKPNARNLGGTFELSAS